MGKIIDFIHKETNIEKKWIVINMIIFAVLLCFYVWWATKPRQISYDALVEACPDGYTTDICCQLWCEYNGGDNCDQTY